MEIPDGRHRFRVVSPRSAVLVEARSNVGLITFASSDISGQVEVDTVGGVISLDPAPEARLSVAIGSLVSGNTLYDAELHRRVNARRFPQMHIEMTSASAAGTAGRFNVAGVVSFHDTTRVLEGTVVAALPDPTSITILGEQRLDIRDFDISAPAVAMLKIYPDVRVLLHLEAELTAEGGS